MKKSTMDSINELSLKPLSADEIHKIEQFRKSNRTAVLAILFSDIVGSTHAAEKLGEQTYSRLRHIHDALFKKIMCRDNVGIIIKEIGDSFLCVFAEPSTSVLRAVEFQRAIYSNRENLSVQDYTLTVKIGIHLGQVAVENVLAMDIFGRHVNRAARIEAIARGGQILTSRSIWENAVGWLKDHDHEQIAWIRYGSTKLKGIEERIDVFAFYPKELGKLPAPGIMRKQKLKRSVLAVITFLLVALAAAYFLNQALQNSNPEGIALLSEARKPYYVQFDFSEISKHSNGSSSKLMIDTLALSDIMLTQIIAILNPDSVITEADLIKSFSRKGKLYARNKNIDSYDVDYFRDTLKLAGAIFIDASQNENQKTDSINLIITLFNYSYKSYAVNVEHSYVSENNCGTVIRNVVQDMMMANRLWSIQGYVTKSNDSLVLFKLSEATTLRSGAIIRFHREYKEMEGMRQRLEDLKEQIAFFNLHTKDSSRVRFLANEYSETENEIAKSRSKGRWSRSIELTGKVLEVYDSTATASWKRTGEFPEKPRQGDVIYLGY